MIGNTLNFYVIVDTVADDIVVTTCSNNDSLFVRQNSKMVQQINPNFLNDFKIYCIGSMNKDDLSLTSCKPRLVSWDSYKLPPENPMVKEQQ